jgi:hypothetical protein
MDRYSLQESMSGADNEEEETVASSSEGRDSATDPVAITPPPPEVRLVPGTGTILGQQ